MRADLVRAPCDKPNAAQAVWPARFQHLHLGDDFFIPRRCQALHMHFVNLFKMAQIRLVNPLRRAARSNAQIFLLQHILPDDFVQCP